LELYSNDTDNEKGKLTWKQTAKAVLNDENYLTLQAAELSFLRMDKQHFNTPTRKTSWRISMKPKQIFNP